MHAHRNRSLALLIAVLILLPGAPPLLRAHDAPAPTAVVIETDMGLDDAVALALALQHPLLDIEGIIATEGVAGPVEGEDRLGRLLSLFNRSDIPAYEATAPPAGRSIPPFRATAGAFLDAALPGPDRVPVRPLRPQAYAPEGPVTVAALGPLTQLASVVARDPELPARIVRVVIPGEPDPERNWNLRRDPEALASLRASGIPLTFVVPGPASFKPPSWASGGLSGTQRTSIGEAFFGTLMAVPGARTHYATGLERLHDELAVLYLVRPDLFEQQPDGVCIPRNGDALFGAFTRALSDGRQRKDRVVFSDRPFPSGVLRADVEAAEERIRPANGEDEWFAMLMMNELHDHLGAYSIIGVKMGLRAAELLNAPPHAMRVLSRTPSTQPVSCLNDGLLVATGSTPGRALFRNLPGPPGTVEAEFDYNGRRLALKLKPEYGERIRSVIGRLVAEHGLEDPHYWEEVRAFGLEIWERWHRRDLFEIASPDANASPNRSRAPSGP